MNSVSGKTRSAAARAGEIVERDVDITLGGDIDDVDLQPQRRRRRLRPAGIGCRIGIVLIGQNADHARRRQQRLQQLQLFRHQIVGEKARAGDVAARPAHAVD